MFLKSFHIPSYIQAVARANFGLAWNSAFFYLNGKMVGSYSKHSDYQETLFHEELSVAIPSDEPPIIRIGDLTIGIEICLDHNCQVLKNYISEQSRQETINPELDYLKTNPDIHLVLSAAVEYKEMSVKSCGYFIHSSNQKIELLSPVLNREKPLEFAYRKVNNILPGYPLSKNYLLGLYCFIQGDYTRALNFFQQVPEQNTEYYQAQYYYGLCLIKKGHTEDNLDFYMLAYSPLEKAATMITKAKEALEEFIQFLDI